MNRIISVLSALLMTASCTVNTVPSGTNPLEGRSIAFIGDSISYGTNWQGGYGKIIGEENNMTVTNTSRGGATLAKNAQWTLDSDGTRPCVLEMAQKLDGEYDYIIAEGGINDFWAHVALGNMTDSFDGGYNEDTVTGAMESMFYTIRNNHPESKAGFVIIHDPFTYDAEAEFEPIYERMKAVCDKWEVPYLDLYSQNNQHTGVNVRDEEQKKLYFASADRPDGDGCHPNELGYREIYAKPMNEWLKTF